MISRDDILAAHARITPHIRRTPVLSLGADALGIGHGVSLKLEHLQTAGSFKLRGAYNNLLSRDVPAAGVVAISGGNHGAGVAVAATRLGHKATVFVPGLIAVDVKIQRMRDYGAEVVVVPGDVDAAVVEYQNFADTTGALAIHPYDHPATLAGQGTVAAEIEDQLPDLDTLFVSVGGGGLIGGVLSWYHKRIKIVAVETDQTQCLAQSIAKGERVIFKPGGISASGLGSSSIGELPWAVIQSHLGENVVVSDADTFDAGRRLWDSARLVVEPGAATALAALTSGVYRAEKDERIGVLSCGGNADPNWFEGAP